MDNLQELIKKKEHRRRFYSGKHFFILISVVLFILLLNTIKVKDTGKAPSPTPEVAKEEKVEPNTNEPVVKTGDLTAEKKLVTITTSKGDIEMELYPHAAPKTVENFLKKAGGSFLQQFNMASSRRLGDSRRRS